MRGLVIGSIGVLLCLVLAGCTTLVGGVGGTRAGQTPGETPTVAEPREMLPVVLVIDSSGSMAAPDMGGQTTRLAAAQAAARTFVEGLPEGTPVGLVSFGDQSPPEAPLSPETCADVTVRVPPGPVAPAFLDQVNGLAARGWTPISAALTKAAETVPEGPAHIVLITDGEDSCAPPDPCETAAALVAQHPGLAISTIGVRASSPQLGCIAARGNGVAITADSATQLAGRLNAMHDPAHAATLLSPRGLAGIAPGAGAADIRSRYPDFPEVPSVQAGSLVEVVWRNCSFGFDERGVLREITLGSDATIDGLRIGGDAAGLAVLGSPVVVQPRPGGGETRIYVADAASGLGWYVEVEGGRIVRIVLCSCLSAQMTSDWVPCSGAQWAVEGEDRSGRLVAAMCEDGLGLFQGRNRTATYRVEKRSPFGAVAVSADGRQRIEIEDARSDVVINFRGATSNAGRTLVVTKRYPDTTCAVTAEMLDALGTEGLDWFATVPLKAVCVDGWARVNSDEPGDSTLVLRPVAQGYQFYAGFPTSICRSAYQSDGGPEAFASSFREC